MYEYSPIRKLYIKNFRNLGAVEIDFSQSPIIALVGENEAGKTSVIKAFATCALHASPRDQKDYIRDGTKMFGVAIELEDGKRVVRIKEASGINSYQITDSQGNLIWNTNKLADGLPIEVQKIMGLIAEPETNEFLHIRTYEDKLLFVVTPNSTNYKVMYNALKVEQLTKAIKLGSGEVNTLKSDINSNEASMMTLQNQIRGITIIDTEPLTNVRDRLTEQIALLDKIEHAKLLMDTVNQCEIQLGALALIEKFNLDTINELLASKLSNASRLLSNNIEKTNLLSKMSNLSTLEEIDTHLVDKTSVIIAKIQGLGSKVTKAGELMHLSDISDISEVEVMQLNKIASLTNKMKSLETKKSSVDIMQCDEIKQNDIDSIGKMQKVITFSNTIESNKTQLEQINVYIGQVQNYLKQCGVAVETCPNCGSDVIIDIDKIGD